MGDNLVPFHTGLFQIVKSRFKEEEERKKRFQESVGRLFGTAKKKASEFGEEVSRRAIEEAEETRKFRAPALAKKLISSPILSPPEKPLISFGKTEEEARKNNAKIIESVVKGASQFLIEDPARGIASFTSSKERKKREKEVGKFQAYSEMFSAVPLFGGITKPTKFASKAPKAVSLLGQAGARVPKLKLPTVAGDTILEVAGGRYNLADLNVADDVLNLIQRRAKETTDLIRVGRRGKVTFEETRAAADNIGMTIDKLLKTKVGKTFNDAEIVAAGDMFKTVSQETNNLSKAFREAKKLGKATDEMRLTLLQKASQQAMIQAKVLGLETEAGRALNATKIAKMAQLSEPEKNLNKLIKQLDLAGRDDLDEVLIKFNQLTAEKGPEAGYRYILSMFKSGFGDKLRETWYNFILSGPQTHLINFISNTVFTAFAPIEKFGSAVAEIPVAAIQRRPRERLFGEAAANVYGLAAGMKEGVKKSLHMLVNGYGLDDMVRLELQRPEAILTGKLGAIKPTRWLSAADQFNRAVNYSGELHALAYRRAIKEGFKGKELAPKIAEIISNPPMELFDEAGKLAKYRTFMEDPGSISKRVLDLRRVLGPVGVVLAPFVSTPVNLVKVGTQRSPAGFLLNVPRARGAEVSDSIARATIGSSIAAAAALYAIEGKITGAPPRDKAERDAFYRSGKQPYSIKIGNKWISYQRLEPFNIALTQVSSVMDAYKDTGKIPNIDVAFKIASNIGRNLISQTYLQGINNVFNAIDEPDRYGSRLFESFAVSILPASSFLRTVTRIIDPTIRNPESVQEALMASIPGLSFQVLPRRTVFGEAVKREGGPLGQIFPIKITTEQKDFVDEELKNLGVTIGFPQETRFKKTGKKGREAVDLFLSSSGGFMKHWLYNYFNTDEYKQLSGDDKVKSVDKIKDLSRDKFRNRILASAYLFNENQLQTKEEKKKFFDNMVEEDVINSNVADWIIFYRNEPSQLVPF